MKHTKGPWVCDGNGFEPTWDISGEHGSLATVNGEADARLITVAPDMLELLLDIASSNNFFAERALEILKQIKTGGHNE